jgi:hypothetical protein
MPPGRRGQSGIINKPTGRGVYEVMWDDGQTSVMSTDNINIDHERIARFLNGTDDETDDKTGRAGRTTLRMVCPAICSESVRIAQAHQHAKLHAEYYQRERAQNYQQQDLQEHEQRMIDLRHSYIHVWCFKFGSESGAAAAAAQHASE